MKIISRRFVPAVIFLIVIAGALALGCDSEAQTRGKQRCFLLLYNDCFNNNDFKPNAATWNQSLIVLDYDAFNYRRIDLKPVGNNISGGVWFQFNKSIFLHQLCSSVVGPICGSGDPGLPVYGGSMSGVTKGQGLMTKTTGPAGEDPVCWSLNKSVPKNIQSQCPFPASSDAGKAEGPGLESEEDQDDHGLAEPDENDAEIFMKMRNQWFKP
jgi:hypothetical protein